MALVLASTFQLVNAQDIHFSQFYSQPLLLNPAMTGNVSESYRFALTYRNQWSSIPAPYNTIAASFDASLLGCQLGNDHVGVGASFFNDRSGDGVLQDNSVMLSVAYHKGLDAERRFMLTAGIQGGYKHKSINVENLLFSEQINESLEFDPTLSNGENFASNSFGYFDMRAGGMLTAAPSPNINFYMGGAYYHFTEPQETFLNESAEKNLLDARLVFHAGGTFFLGDAVSLSPSAIYQSQTASQEILIGTAFGVHFGREYNRYRRKASSGSGLYLGGWYRLDDAIIFMVGVDFQNFRFGFSYDINVSPLNEASQYQGGVELAINLTGQLTECKRQSPTYCPRF